MVYLSWIEYYMRYPSIKKPKVIVRLALSRDIKLIAERLRLTSLARMSIR